jgi:hypothetical protein
MRLFHSLMNLFERGAHAGAAPLPAERLDEIPFFFFLLSVGQGRTPCLCGEGQRLVAHAPLVVCIVERDSGSDVGGGSSREGARLVVHVVRVACRRA